MAMAYFPMYGSYEAVFESLTDEQIGALTRGCLEYFNTGRERIPNDPVLIPLFVMLCQSIDRSGAAYTDRCEKNRAAARKRWGKTGDGGTVRADEHERIPDDEDPYGAYEPDDPAEADACGWVYAERDRGEEAASDASACGRMTADADEADERALIPADADEGPRVSADASACKRMQRKEKEKGEEKREKEGEEERKEKKKEKPPCEAGGRGRTRARPPAHIRARAGEDPRKKDGRDREDRARRIGERTRQPAGRLSASGNAAIPTPGARGTHEARAGPPGADSVLPDAVSRPLLFAFLPIQP